MGLSVRRIKFLSTLSLRRATFFVVVVLRTNAYFYPRSPCGERRLVAGKAQAKATISIHALLAESDLLLCGIYHYYPQFLSTLSLRRATQSARYPARICMDFYPRSPCGERRVSAAECTRQWTYFYPRSPCGERLKLHGGNIRTSRYFYPRSPCGERQNPCWTVRTHPIFLSTLSLRRATRAA